MPAALAAGLFAFAFLTVPAAAQAPSAIGTGTANPTPASAELTACKATALSALSQRDAAIRDIFIDEDSLTIANADTKVEDTPVKRIFMGDAYLQTSRQDKPRRFLCLVGEKGKVLLTFFTQN
jgi:hypothetical protein